MTSGGLITCDGGPLHQGLLRARGGGAARFAAGAGSCCLPPAIGEVALGILLRPLAAIEARWCTPELRLDGNVGFRPDPDFKDDIEDGEWPDAGTLTTGVDGATVDLADGATSDNCGFGAERVGWSYSTIPVRACVHTLGMVGDDARTVLHAERRIWAKGAVELVGTYDGSYEGNYRSEWRCWRECCEPLPWVRKSGGVGASYHDWYAFREHWDEPDPDSEERLYAGGSLDLYIEFDRLVSPTSGAMAAALRDGAAATGYLNITLPTPPAMNYEIWQNSPDALGVATRVPVLSYAFTFSSAHNDDGDLLSDETRQRTASVSMGPGDRGEPCDEVRPGHPICYTPPDYGFRYRAWDGDLLWSATGPSLPGCELLW